MTTAVESFISDGNSILKLSKIVAPTSENVSLSLSLLESLNFGE